MVGEATASGGKPTASANRRLSARSCDMNDTSNHALQNPRHRVLTATWHALLTLASAPLWDRVVPAPSPLRAHPPPPAGGGGRGPRPQFRSAPAPDCLGGVAAGSSG